MFRNYFSIIKLHNFAQRDSLIKSENYFSKLFFNQTESLFIYFTKTISLNSGSHWTGSPSTLWRLSGIGEDPSILLLLLHLHLLVSRVSLAEDVKPLLANHKETILAPSLQSSQLFESTFWCNCQWWWLEQSCWKVAVDWCHISIDKAWWQEWKTSQIVLDDGTWLCKICWLEKPRQLAQVFEHSVTSKKL